MAKENKNEPVRKEIDRSGINFTSDAESTINSAALGNQDLSGDELSLVEAMQGNAFVLFFTRLFIKVKNHIAIIPMITVIITMMIITFTIQVHVQATIGLKNDSMNAFWFFVNVVLSFVLVLIYINIQSKKIEKKKWIIMMALFYAVVIGQALIDILYMRDIKIELDLFNATNTVSTQYIELINRSHGYTMGHLVFLIIDAVLAGLVPVLQPITRKIQIRKKKKA